MSSFSERMQHRMDELHSKQVDIIRKTGISKSLISMYLSGGFKPKQTNLYKIAQVLDVNEAWLMGLDENSDRNPPLPGRLASMGNPDYDNHSSGAVGLPIMKNADFFSVYENRDTYKVDGAFMLLSDPQFLLSREYADLSSTVSADFALIAPDNSMLEYGIREGDIVCMRLVDQIDSGDIVAWVDGGKILLREVTVYPDQVVFSPGSPHYPSARYENSTEPSFVILGKAVSSITDLTRW